MVTYLYKSAIQVDILKLNALILYVHVEVSVARTDGTITLDDPALWIVERRGERNGVADELAVAGCLVL